MPESQLLKGWMLTISVVSTSLCLVRYTAEGTVVPVSFLWEDGHRYQIERVKNIQRCASRKAGGCGIMYTCIVQGKETHLYFEDDSAGRWFLERKVS